MAEERVLTELRDERIADIDKYISLRNLKSRCPAVFFSLLQSQTLAVLPYIYTPVVGEACERYFELPLQPWGLYITYNDRHNILGQIEKSWHQAAAVRICVVTDSERILGLGDLGAGGLGISEGKILLYTAAAGVDPSMCLPVCLDVGTNNEALLKDPRYRGLRQKRVTGDDYDEFVAEFIAALRAWQPHIVLQFEDFGNHNAFRLLHTYQNQLCCFNDDIQGTACVCLAALMSTLRVTGTPLHSMKVLFFGAGEAGVGIGELVALAMASFCGMTVEEGRRRCFYMDSKGLVCASRGDLQPHKRPFAHDVPPQRDLLAAIQALQPTALVGVSTIAGAFTRDVIHAMLAHCDRPAVFPLSNPTSKAECTFEQAVRWGGGRVLFASGSPFDAVTVDDVTLQPSQANNAYVFPAVGHAAVLARATSLPDALFLRAATVLSEAATDADLARGALFPSFDQILSVSKLIMTEVGQYLEDAGLGTRPTDAPWSAIVEAAIWHSSKLEHSRL